MIRIIGGKRYDTDTAAEIHSCTFTGPDNSQVTETLHCSPNDQLFIARHTVVFSAFGPEEIVDAGDWRLLERCGAELLEWLERADAPESAYIESRVEIEEG